MNAKALMKNQHTEREQSLQCPQQTLIDDPAATCQHASNMCLLKMFLLLSIAKKLRDQLAGVSHQHSYVWVVSQLGAGSCQQPISMRLHTIIASMQVNWSSPTTYQCNKSCSNCNKRGWYCKWKYAAERSSAHSLWCCLELLVCWVCATNKFMNLAWA